MKRMLNFESQDERRAQHRPLRTADNIIFVQEYYGTCTAPDRSGFGQHSNVFAFLRNKPIYRDGTKGKINGEEKYKTRIEIKCICVSN